ncbi:MAG: hypothetical protein IJD41_04360 [Alphaproteobacteria bacterium]|nr:hypothetical protein [Alphaproteobacteria bacterium]
MKKLTAGIFTVLIGLCAANSADASVASTGWVEDQVEALATTVETNKTTAANATKAVSDALTEYKTSNDAAVALKADQTSLNATNTLVGTLPADAGADTIVGYIQKRTEGIATNAALGELQTQVSGNTTAISTLNGSGEGSVAKTIADYVTGLNLANTYGAKSAVEANASAIADIEGSAYATSGITSAKVSTYDGYAAQINAKEALANKLETEEEVTIDETNQDTLYPTIGRVMKEINTTVTEVNNDVSALTSGLSSLNTTVTNNATTAANATAAVAKDLSDYQTENDAAVKANTDAITAINDVDDGILAQAKEYAKQQADAASGSASGVASDLAAYKTTVSQTYATQEALGTTNTNVSGLTTRVGTNETNIAANAENIAKNAKTAADNATAIAENAANIAKNVTAIAAAQAQADKGVADAATAQATANAAKTTADAAIPKPTEDCTTLGAKCVLTVGNSGYVWESIERAEGENVQ